MFEIRRVLILLLILFCLTSSGYGQNDFGFTPVSKVLDNWDYGYTMEIKDSILYVATSETGLGLINISDPENPQMMPTFTNENGFRIQPSKLKIIGNRAYFSSYSSLVIADIEDPENIEVIASIDNYRVDYCEADDKYFIVRGYSNQVMGTLFINIEDSENPREVFFYDQGLNGAIIHDDIAYCLGGALIAVDLSDPDDVRLLATYIPEFRISGTMKIEGNILYVAGNQNLTLVNIENPENIELLFREEYEEYLLDFCVEDGIFYSIWSGDIRHVEVWDFNDPQDPQQLGSFEIGQDQRTIRKYNSTLITLSAKFPHFETYNIENNNFENPPLIYSDEHPGHVKDVEVNGNTAYVVLTNTGLGILDITDVEQPELLTTFEVPEPRAQDNICYYRDHVYYNTPDYGVLIINVSDRENPQLASQIEGVRAREIYAVDDLFFAACYNAGLLMYDIDNPNDPQLIWHWQHNSIYCVSSISNFVYVTERIGDNDGAIHVFDISNIRNPIELNETEGQYNFIVCSEDFVVNGTNQIIPVQNKNFQNKYF